MSANQLSQATDKPARHIVINIAQQRLTLYQGQNEISVYPVSTAKNGIGSQQDSGCTPLGRHIIAQKIGDHMPMNTVFVGRVPTGEQYSTDLAAQYPARDWILCRILWLAGLEEGVNKGCNDQGGCDTYERYIYIHGLPDSEPMDVPNSHGCIRVRNAELIELFEHVEVGTPVTIIKGV